MGQKVGDDQLGIALVSANVHGDGSAVCHRRHAVQLHGDGHPLILADTAIVMGLEIGQLAVLIQRIRLQIQPGGVDVGSRDLRALRDGLAADMGQQHALAPVADIHLVPGAQGLPTGQRFVTRPLRQPDGLCGAETLRLTGVQKRHIVPAIGLHLFQLRRIHTVKTVFPAAQQLFL